MANELQMMPSTGRTITSYLSGDNVKANIAKVVTEKNTDRFITSIVSAVQANPALAKCTNQSILSAALMGESLQLPPSPQLGYYYFVGYKNKKHINDKWIEVEEAQFQLGWKGMLQLAIRSGQYKNIVVNVIKEGEITYNPITEEIDLHPIEDPAEREKAATIGYYAAFELMSGFKKQLFRPIEAIQAHAERYSRSYRNDIQYKQKKSIWSTNFDAMAKKTMLRELIGKWGIMSVEMQQAYINDMSVIDDNGTARYVDNVSPSIDDQVQEEITVNANSVAFDDADVIDAEEVVGEPPKREKTRRGRPPKNPNPIPEPITEPEMEPEVEYAAPEWE